VSVKVKTPILATFTMPGLCIGCGDPPTPGAKHKAEHSRTAGKRTATTSLEFPVCQRCAEASRQRLVGWIPLGLALLIAIWPGFAAFMLLLGAIFSMDLQALILGLVIAAFTVAVLLLGGWLKQRIDTWGMTAEQRQRRRIVDRSVRISQIESGSVVFEFEDPAYALGFSNMNLGQLT